MARHRFTMYELDVSSLTINYYVCDKEKDKPPLKGTNPGDLCYVKESKTLYVADGEWVKNK